MRTCAKKRTAKNKVFVHSTHGKDLCVKPTERIFAERSKYRSTDLRTCAKKRTARNKVFVHSEHGKELRVKSTHAYCRAVKITEYGLAHVCEKEDGKSSAVGCVRHINSGTDLRVKYISARRKK